MQFLADLGRRLRDLADSGTILQSDALSVSVKRPAMGVVWKLCTPLYEVPELWDDDCPEATSDGLPTSGRQREILLALAGGPKKVDAIARALKVEPPRLYDRGASLRDLAALELVELGPDGYSLTSKGRRAAALIQAETEE